MAMTTAKTSILYLAKVRRVKVLKSNKPTSVCLVVLSNFIALLSEDDENFTFQNITKVNNSKLSSFYMVNKEQFLKKKPFLENATFYPPKQ